MSTRILVLAMLGVGLAAGPVRAQDVQEKVDVHGFGSWAFGDTNHNVYLAGLPDRNYTHSDLGLNVNAQVSDRLKIVAQSQWTESHSETGSGVDLTYIFAEWKVSDALRFRAGQIKQPFGIYGEIFAIGTLRPFLDLPQGVYGPVGFASDSYKGFGLTGTHALGKSWSLSYDIYGGGVDLEEFVTPEQYLRGEPVSEETSIEGESTKDVIGGRVVLQTPVDGLSVGASAYGGHEIGSNHRTVYAFQGEYLAGPWSIRTEYAHETVKDDLLANGFYAEAAYRINKHFQLAAQYDHLTTELPGADVSKAPSLLDHKEAAFGLNYWISPAFVIKASYHHVDGNRFAGPAPDDLALTVATGQLETKTNLFQFGAQFSF